MKVKEYKSISIVAKWLLRIGASENTERSYFDGLKTYCDFLHKTPVELILEAEAEIKAGKLMRERDLETYLLSYRKHLLDSGLAPLTVKTRMTGVLSFYNSNYIDLPKLPKTNKMKPLEENLTIPTREQIQEVLKYCDPLEKAVILVGVSSGISANEIRNLKVKDFVGQQDENSVTTLDLRRGKSKVDFITFLTPEATRAVQDYIDFRNREPHINDDGLIKHLKKQKIYSPNDYLFIHRYVRDEYLKTKNEKWRTLKEGTFEHLYNYISAKRNRVLLVVIGM